MQEVARKDDNTSCPATTLIILPHLGGPLFNATPVHMEVDGRSVIRLGDYAKCQLGAPLDVVIEGAATFTVCGLPVARKGDHMVHGGLIIEGSPDVMVGGPTFTLPANMKLSGPASFQSDVIKDLYLLSTTRTGKTVLDGLGASGKQVTIEPESDPHNSFATPGDGDDSHDGTGTDTVVHYNPNAAVFAEDDQRNTIPMAPQVLLGHELIHAYHNAHGNNATNAADPNPPATHPGIPSEEAQTIGTGSYTNGFPSENSLRADLNLPRRDNWWFHNDDGSGNELTAPTADMRPGKC